MYKKVLLVSLAVSLISFLVCGAALGQLDQERGKMCELVLNGEDIIIEGTVIEKGKKQAKGHRLFIDVNEETFRVNRLGPEAFWTELGVTPPVTGNSVHIEAKKIINKKGKEKNIAMNIRIDSGNTIQLRDTETGCALWKNNNGCKKVLEGDAATIEGTVAEKKSKRGLKGNRLFVDIGGETSRVSRLGPDTFWESLGITLPAAGENVSVEVRKITNKKGKEINVAMSIRIAGGDPIQLRDPETGCPLWKNEK